MSLTPFPSVSRPEKRIPIVMKHIDWADFINELGFTLSEEEKDKIVLNCQIRYNDIFTKWKESPDLRLTQVLATLEIVPNFAGGWFYIEESDYMVRKNFIKPEEILFWGSYGKSGKLEDFHWVLINDMETKHIENCLSTQKNMKPVYRQAMTNVLRKRKIAHLNDSED